MRDDGVLKAASGLAGGIGHMADVCGALLGASLMLSLKFGRERKELDKRDKLDNACDTVGKLYKWFEKEFGSVKCREVRTRFAGVYYDMNVKWQAELARESGAFKKCDELIGRTAARAAEALLEPVEKREKRAAK